MFVDWSMREVFCLHNGDDDKAAISLTCYLHCKAIAALLCLVSTMAMTGGLMNIKIIHDVGMTICDK